MLQHRFSELWVKLKLRQKIFNKIRFPPTLNTNLLVATKNEKPPRSLGTTITIFFFFKHMYSSFVFWAWESNLIARKAKGSLRNFAMKVIIICKINKWMQFVTNASSMEPPSDIPAFVRIIIEMFAFNFPFEILCIWNAFALHSYVNYQLLLLLV